MWQTHCSLYANVWSPFLVLIAFCHTEEEKIKDRGRGEEADRRHGDVVVDVFESQSEWLKWQDHALVDDLRGASRPLGQPMANDRRNMQSTAATQPASLFCILTPQICQLLVCRKLRHRRVEPA